MQTVHITCMYCDFLMSPASLDLRFPDVPCHVPRELSLREKLCKTHETQAYSLFKWWKNINYFLSNKDMKIIIVNKV